MNIQKMIHAYISQGYDDVYASAKVCQDIILFKISKSKFNRNITLKGGIVIHNLSNNIRRATNDIDLDFIKYSLDDDTIRQFIDVLNKVEDDIKIIITDNIIPLHHQDYKGKRVSVSVCDNYGNELKTKIDIGINTHLDIHQNTLLFNFDPIGSSGTLLVNTPEQIFCEKMKSLMIHGINSTRYKDIYDFYYLIDSNLLSVSELKYCIKKLIFDDKSININNFKELSHYFSEIINDDLYMNKLKNPKINWIDEEMDAVISVICDFIGNL